ncbi:MAG: xanthine dehydrogenase family protein subunit M [Rhizobiales bacterium]|nr:xanthine dehydrogenase family protein subunit M [Hyphomicrobiales bacterium]
MKAAPFEYSRPADIDEACALLGGDEGARIIAGGQTLVPMMAMRLSRPTRLIDVSRISALSYIREEDGHLAIGAATRQCVVENDPIVATRMPLLAAVMPWIGHAATRARGTVGGSLANADPAAELALVAVTLDATLTYREAGRNGDIPASEFFIGPTITALPMAACLMEVRFPIWRDGHIGVGFHEVSARRSDFAFVSAAAQVTVDEDGICRRIAIGVGAVTDVPIRLERVEQELSGNRPDAARLRPAIEGALADVDVTADLHASAPYRRRVAATLALRAITDALASAKQRGPDAC